MSIRIGIIGSGWIVENAHLIALGQNNSAEVVAMLDSNTKGAKVVADKYRITCVTDQWEEFVDQNLEGIIIATPNYTHVDYTLKALNAGISVLCEKPVAFKSDEINQIMLASKENNALYIPGFVNRFRDDIQDLTSIIKNGEIGRVKTINAGWIRKCGVPRPGTWFTHREFSGGGALIDIGSHVVDIVQSLLTEELQIISLEVDMEELNTDIYFEAGNAKWFHNEYSENLNLDVEKSVVAKAKLVGDVDVNLHISWYTDVEGDSTYFDVKGTDGEVCLKTLFGFSNECLYPSDTLEVQNNKETKTKNYSKELRQSYNAFIKLEEYFISTLESKKVGFLNIHDAFQTVSFIESIYNEA